MPSSGIDPGFASGFLGATGDLQSQQSGQIAQALELARVQMEQSRAQHQQRMDEWAQNPQNPMNIHWQAYADTMREKAQTDEDYKKQLSWDQALEQGRKLEMAGIPTGQAYSRLDKLDPKEAENFRNMGYLAYKNLKAQEYQTQFGVDPNSPQPPSAGMGTPPPMSNTMPSQGIPQTQGPPQPSRQAMTTAGPMLAGGPTGAMANGAPMMFGSPQAVPPVPAQMGPPSPPPPNQSATGGNAEMTPPGVGPPSFVNPTMEQYLSTQSPAYLAARQKEIEKAQSDRIRALAYQTGQEARDTLADPDHPRWQAMLRAADARGKDAETRATALEQRVGPYAKDIDTVEAAQGIQQKLANSLVLYRQLMGQAATKNATTKATNGSQAAKIWNDVYQQGQDADKLAEQYTKQSIEAQKGLNKALEDQELYQGAIAKDPNNKAAEDMLLGTIKRVSQLKQQYEAIKTKADLQQRAADSYKALAGKMYKDRVEAGYVDHTDNQGAGSTPRSPNTLPSVPLDGGNGTSMTTTPPSISSQQGYDMLSPGAVYIDARTGQTKRKKGP